MGRTAGDWRRRRNIPLGDNAFAAEQGVDCAGRRTSHTNRAKMVVVAPPVRGTVRVHRNPPHRVQSRTRRVPPIPFVRSMRLLAAFTLTMLAVSGMLLVHLRRDPLAWPRLREHWQVRRAGATLLADGVSLVRQREPSACGPAALAMLLQLRGYRVPPPEVLMALSGATPRGTSLRRLAAAATALGAPATVTRFPSNGQRGPLPLLALMSSKHFVVLEARRPYDVIVVLDPQVGRYAIAESALRRRWDGLALLVPPRAPPVARRLAPAGAHPGLIGVADGFDGRIG